MKRILPIILAALFCAAPLSAEYLFLTDGSIIGGSIISETVTAVVFRSARDKKVTRYPRTNVMRVLYTELNMGRLYVQMKSGDNMLLFMVDEDRTTYTFRKELYKPEELKLERADVLFVAERNPSKLIGKADYTSIEIEWYPPFDEMKYYNIYIKNKKEDPFIVAGTSSKKSFHLKNLKGNTKYLISVTGVDKNKEETPHSNLLEISTLNTLPYAPGGLEVTANENGTVTAQWKPAVDPDGIVKKYRVFIVKGKDRTLFGETEGTRIVITKSPLKIDRIQVVSVDNSGAESKISDIRAFQPYTGRLAFTPMLLFPFAEFGKMGSVGYGGTVSYLHNDIFFRNTRIGLEGGYFYIPGVNSLNDSGQKVERINFVPFGIKTGYQFNTKGGLYLSPAVTAGAAYIDTACVNSSKNTGILTDNAHSGIDMMTLVSVSAGWNISENFFWGIRGDYGILFEKDKLLHFALCGIDMGWRF